MLRESFKSPMGRPGKICLIALKCDRRLPYTHSDGRLICQSDALSLTPSHAASSFHEIFRYDTWQLRQISLAEPILRLIIEYVPICPLMVLTESL